MTIIVGSDGKHVAFEIDGKRVNIDEIPEAMREYSNAAAGTLEFGYNMGKTTKSVADTCEKLLVKLEDQVEKDIESLQDDVKGIESSVASTITAQAASVDAKLALVDAKIADSKKTISASVDAKLKAYVFRVWCWCPGRTRALTPVLFTRQAATHRALSNSSFSPSHQCLLTPPAHTHTYTHTLRAHHMTINHNRTQDTIDKDVTSQVKKAGEDVRGLQVRFACLDADLKYNPAKKECCKKYETFNEKEKKCELSAGMSEDTPAESCMDIKFMKSGIYWLKTTGGKVFQTYCDNDNNDGGWSYASTFTAHQSNSEWNFYSNHWIDPTTTLRSKLLAPFNNEQNNVKTHAFNGTQLNVIAGRRSGHLPRVFERCN